MKERSSGYDRSLRQAILRMVQSSRKKDLRVRHTGRGSFMAMCSSIHIRTAVCLYLRLSPGIDDAQHDRAVTDTMPWLCE
jgi:hypothetical protein